MKNRKIDALMPLIIALALAAGILIGIKFRDTAANTGNNRGLLLFSTPNKVDRTLDLLKSSYVDSVSTNMLEEDAIEGMLKNLDPHSQYFPASDFSAVNDPLEGNFSGIGVSFNMPDDTIVVVNTIAEGPSEKSGIMAGDRIIRVNDSLVAGVKMSSNDIAKMLKGKTGTRVKVGIQRKGNSELLDFDIIRGKIPLFSIDAAYMITPEIGYIKVSRFSKTTLQEFADVAGKLKTEGMTKTIIDLRDNLGGIIDGAIGMCEMLLPAGKLIVYTSGIERGRTDYYSNSRDTEYNRMDLVLLINESSASASEIVAGAIQDNDRGTIVGRRSFGKGLVQEQYSFSDGSAIRITVARYYTPTGRCIQKPYDHNENGEYFNELYERYSHGEMIRADSIRFNDSLRFVTPGGKVVYGGGGIMPDIFMPIDTAGYSSYYGQVMRRRLIYRFAFDYVDKNRKDLSNFPDDKSLVTYLHQKDILGVFIAYAARQGVAKNNKDLKISGPMIENTVMAYIGRNIMDDRGFYPILNRMDQTVQKGVDVLTKQNFDHFHIR
ncbi:MAG: S41 family peptidase [Bacteroidales bacterium]|nr:S41 family peptidase [Bacteroidales bacterium]